LDHRAHTVKPVDQPVAPKSPRPPRAAGAIYVGLAVLAIAELAWLAWFLIVPLPNANNVGTPSSRAVRRGWLLLKAFPEVVPETTFRESFLGHGLKALSHIENLPQRLPILLTAGLIAAAAIGLGDMALRGLKLEAKLCAAERTALDYGLGAGLLGVITLVLGRMGWLDPRLFRAGLGLLAVAGLATSRLWRASRFKLNSSSCLLGIVIAPFVVVMILGSMLPSIDFDVLEYHLEGPKEYFKAGQIGFLPHNVYTSMPFGVEMLHLAAMEVMGDWWWGGLAGQLLIALFALAATVLIASTALRVGSARAAWFAAIVYISTPWVYRLAVIAYVEGPLCFYHAALVWAAVLGFRDRSISRRSIWLLLGLLAGSAMGCKYPALISAVIPLGVLSLLDCQRSRSLAPLLCYVLGWGIVMGPWLGKNVIDTGNPVYPLSNSIFHGRYWNQDRETKWWNAHGRKAVTGNELAASLVDVAGRSDWQSSLYLALAPLAFLRRGSRPVTWMLWGFVAYLFATWWLLTHRLDRFWLPLLPTLAVLAGLGADWARNRAWSILLGTIMTIALITNLTYVSTALAGLNDWTGDLVSLRRTGTSSWNESLASLDSSLPAGAHPLIVGQAAVFHLDSDVTYNTVFDPEIIELLASGKTDQEFNLELRKRKLTHIYIDWEQIKRHTQPGGYGFTDFVTRSRISGWVAAGVLDRPLYFHDHAWRDGIAGLLANQELYRVR
jgi:4-amino-4-deoxy-L-arabinose transferase-like glycosyltransferase